MLLSLDADLLLVGYGVASLTEQAAELVVVMEQTAHAGAFVRSYASLRAAGGHAWRGHRGRLFEGGVFGLPRPGDPRGAWRRLHAAVSACLSDSSPTMVALATACTYRREQVDAAADLAVKG